MLLRLNLNRCALVSGLLLFALACLACGRAERIPGGVEADGSRPAVAADQNSIGAPLQLLALLRSGSAGRTTVLASNFVRELPHLRVEPDAELLHFSPQGSAAGQAAYALYVLDAGTRQGSWSLHYQWQSQPSPLASAWIGLGDIGRNAWDWRPVTGLWETRLDDIARYRTADGHVLVAVLATGESPSALASLGLKTPLAYDEQEDNDSLEQAQPLPSLPLYSFRGSIGSTADYPGADGDREDWYRFRTTPGKYLNIVLRVPGARVESTDVEFSLWDSDTGESRYHSSSAYGVSLRNHMVEEDELVLSVSMPEGGTDYELTALELDASNDQPEAIISASAKSGPPGLKVSFDGSASTPGEPEDSIIRYDWDLDGDGVFELQGDKAQVQHVYSKPGVYHPNLRVIDSHGMPSAQSRNSRSLVVVAVADSFPGDEREDNEYGPGSWDALPAIPFSGFRGSLGPGPGTDDGDDFDRFSLELGAGESMSLVVEFDPLPAGQLITGDLFGLNADDEAETIIDSDSDSERLVLSGSTNSERRLLFDLGCRNLQQAVNYTIRVVRGLPPEVTLSASPEFGIPQFGTTLTAQGSDNLDQPLTYLWDLNDDGVYEYASGSSGSLEQGVFVMGPQSYRVRAQDSDGLLSRPAEVTVYGISEIYDEVEDNDIDSKANPLGSLPVLGFRGNIGSAPDAPVYDGDNQDCLRLPDGLSSADALKFIINFDSPVSKPGAYTSGTAGLLDESNPSQLISVYSLDEQPGEPYILRLTSFEFSNYSLDVLRSDVPIPALSISPTGDPLSYQLDASASSDSDGIAGYSFRFDPIGSAEEVDNGASPILLHSFPRAGRYLLQLTVQDNFGAVSNQAGYYLVNVGNVVLSEAEDNDEAAEAQPLPAFPFSDFYGNLGDEAGVPGTDGDSADFFSFNASAGQSVHFDLQRTCGPAIVVMGITDVNGDSVGSVSQTALDHTFSTESGPFTLRVYQGIFPGYLDEYVLSGTLSGP